MDMSATLDEETALQVAQAGANLLPGGTVIGAGLETLGADMAHAKYLGQACQIMGHDENTLHADSPAFKEYADKLSGLYESRLMDFAASAAGSSVAVLTGAMVLGGPPGWLLGGALALGGGFVGSEVARPLIGENHETFLEFAKFLQRSGQPQDGQAGNMPPEAAFVALTMNSSPATIKSVLISLEGSGIKTIDGMVEALKTEEGTARLNKAMRENDALIRNELCLAPQVGNGHTTSEIYAELINKGYMNGVDLLSQEKTTQMAGILNQWQLNAMSEAVRNANPNTHLPYNGKPKQR